jgi:hypothetical protein
VKRQLFSEESIQGLLSSNLSVQTILENWRIMLGHLREKPFLVLQLEFQHRTAAPPVVLSFNQRQCGVLAQQRLEIGRP